MNELRKKIKLARAALSSEFIRDSSLSIQKKFLQTSFTQAEQVAGYLPFQGEVDPTPITEWLWQQNKNYYLPILHPAGYSRLWFMKFTRDTKLIKNRFGILEPQYHSSQLVAPWELDLVLTPLVLFDEACHRMGQGAGFYDRTFQFLKTHSCRKKPALVGLAYEFQKISALTEKPWDVPLHAVITEQMIYGETQ